MRTKVLANQTVNDTGNGFIGPFDITGYEMIEALISSVAFVAGTSPTVTIDLDAVSPDPAGATMNQAATAALTAGQSSTLAAGWASASNKALGTSVRAHYTVAGAPTSLSFYIYLIARES